MLCAWSPRFQSWLQERQFLFDLLASVVCCFELSKSCVYFLCFKTICSPSQWNVKMSE